jgi:thiol-disulfide isomerase/thioredoxin
MRGAVISLAVLGLVALGTLSSTALGATGAPDFVGGGPWFNTDGRALSLQDLRGKVVAVEMWTAGCYNCLNTLPYVKRWYAKYGEAGLVVVGVHTPEFANEHSPQYVREALGRLGITYPVVLDNDYHIWNAYHNAYWPTLYLIDKKGQLRYTHIGEGEYDTTERTIAKLLAEPN